MAKDKHIDFHSIKSMSEEQQQQMYYTLAKRANQRFRDIAKTGEQSGAVGKAERWLIDNFGRTTFKQSKNLTGIELKESLKALETFYTSKTATVTGIKEVRKKQIETLSENFEEEADVKKFKKMMKDKEFKNKFYQFLSSQQFKTLAKYADSDQVIEDFIRANDEGHSFDDIMQGYQDFLNSDMTFEQVAERRRSGGDLLH